MFGLTLECQSNWDLKFLKDFGLFGLPFFFPKVFMKFLSYLRPFSLYLLVSDRHIFDTTCHAMQCLFHVWLCMNEMSMYQIYHFFFTWTCVVFFFWIHCSFCLCAFTSLSFWPVMLLFCLALWKGIFVLMLSYHITISLCLESNIVILWFLHRRKTTRVSLIFSCWILVVTSTLLINST